MINLKNVLRPGGPFTQSFTIKRPTTTFVLGGIVETLVSIPAIGAVTVAKERDLAQVPVADRVTGAMLFISVTEIKVSHGGTGAGTSDTIDWRGDTYRIAKLFPYVDYGFYKAVGVRVSGE